MNHPLLRLAAATLCLSFASAARADTEACAQAYEAAQDFRRDAKLVESRRELVVCAQDTCPAVLRKDCVGWLAEIEDSIPRLSITVRGPDGCDRPQANVWIDGSERAGGANGLPIELDPGVHDVRVATDALAATREVALSIGERARTLTIAFSPEGMACRASAPGTTASLRDVPPLSTPDRSPPIATYVVGAIGVAGLLVGSAFAVSAWSQKATLDRCKGACAQDDVDTMRRTFLGADIGLTAGIVGVAAAAAIYLFGRSHRP